MRGDHKGEASNGKGAGIVSNIIAIKSDSVFRCIESADYVIGRDIDGIVCHDPCNGKLKMHTIVTGEYGKALIHLVCEKCKGVYHLFETNMKPGDFK